MFEKRERETENEKCVKKSTPSPPQTAKIKYNWEKVRCRWRIQVASNLEQVVRLQFIDSLFIGR